MCIHRVTILSPSLNLVYYLENSKTCGKGALLTQRLFHFSLQLLSEAFYAPTNIQRVVLEMRAQKRA
jgi:hypothetical protein